MVFIARNCNVMCAKVWTFARFAHSCVWDCSGLLNGLLWVEALSFYSNARGRVGSRDRRTFPLSTREKCLQPNVLL